MPRHIYQKLNKALTMNNTTRSTMDKTVIPVIQVLRVFLFLKETNGGSLWIRHMKFTTEY